MGLRKTVTVYRKGSKSFDETAGAFVGTDDSTFDIQASVQPLSAGEAAAAADVTQGKESYRLYTDTRLQSVEANTTSDHVVLPDGQKYEVVDVKDWQNGILPHYKIIVRALTPMSY